jgi:hypothetical protein
MEMVPVCGGTPRDTELCDTDRLDTVEGLISAGRGGSTFINSDIIAGILEAQIVILNLKTS